MKIGAVGFGNRITHVFFELKQINKDSQMIAFVDPKPIGKNFAEMIQLIHKIQFKRPYGPA